MKTRIVLLLTLMAALVMSLPAQAQFAAVWNGGTPPTACRYPSMGIDISTGALYACGKGTGWVLVPANNTAATFTNKTFDTAGTGNVFRINGTAITDKTGTGKAVLQTSPTFLTSAILSDATGASMTYGVATEEITLATGATTTDSTANLLPANSIIEAVTGRVTTTITAACTGWQLGDATTAGRFTANDTTLTSGETKVGLLPMAGAISTDAAGPVQTSAAKVRVTCAGGNPGAGKIRVSVFYRTYAAPTS